MIAIIAWELKLQRGQVKAFSRNSGIINSCLGIKLTHLNYYYKFFKESFIIVTNPQICQQGYFNLVFTL